MVAFPKGTTLEYHYVYEGEPAGDFTENVSGKSVKHILGSIMRGARIGNADYVYWEGLYRGDKKLLGKKELTDMAVRVSEGRKLNKVV